MSKQENAVKQPITWSARNVAEALDLIRAVEGRIESAMKAAYPGDSATRLRNGKNTEFHLRITFDPTPVDRIADERSAFDDQVKPLPLSDQP